RVQLPERELQLLRRTRTKTRQELRLLGRLRRAVSGVSDPALAEHAGILSNTRSPVKAQASVAVEALLDRTDTSFDLARTDLNPFEPAIEPSAEVANPVEDRSLCGPDPATYLVTQTVDPTVLR